MPFFFFLMGERCGGGGGSFNGLGRSFPPPLPSTLIPARGQGSGSGSKGEESSDGDSMICSSTISMQLGRGTSTCSYCCVYTAVVADNAVRGKGCGLKIYTHQLIQALLCSTTRVYATATYVVEVIKTWPQFHPCFIKPRFHNSVA